MSVAPTLYWRKKNQEAKAVTPSPFKSEQEFEQVVFDTPTVLGDIFLLRRQVRGGSKAGIPDILGIDPDGKVCVIEMKNTEVDAGVIPQVLEYAIWAETNPDSIKSLWLEAPDRPDDLQIDFDEYGVRVLIVAPSIDRTTLEHVNKIAYPVDLVEVSRWADHFDSWLLVNKLEPYPAKRTKPVSGLRTYDRAVYEELHDPKSVAGFLKAADEIQKLATKKGWPVEGKFNKYYCGFKVGNYVVFGVKWLSTRGYGLFFKVPEGFAKRTRIGKERVSRYEKIWKQAVFRVDSDDTRVASFSPYFEKALEQRAE
jgi:hypothetical protein